mmetsp:Transcript_83903/g.201248  ORF Transcript_83903/g.201248 Transcript_83903/m.201248 type:complete len:347 (-) Transcript_83903:55-1095(-)
MAMIVAAAEALGILNPKILKLLRQHSDVLHEAESLVEVHGQDHDHEHREDLAQGGRSLGSKDLRARDQDVVGKQEDPPAECHEEKQVAHANWHYLEGFVLIRISEECRQLIGTPKPTEVLRRPENRKLPRVVQETGEAHDTLLLQPLVVLIDAELVQKNDLWSQDKVPNSLPDEKKDVKGCIAEDDSPQLIGKNAGRTEHPDCQADNSARQRRRPGVKDHDQGDKLQPAWSPPVVAEEGVIKSGAPAQPLRDRRRCRGGPELPPSGEADTQRDPLDQLGIQSGWQAVEGTEALHLLDAKARGRSIGLEAVALCDHSELLGVLGVEAIAPVHAAHAYRAYNKGLFRA